MRYLIFIILFLGASGKDKHDYEGKYCSGDGDVNYLRLIDESFACFHPNSTVPNLSMLYKPEWDTFVEGAGWGAWWIQNSYGFAYASSPFLEEPWFSMLQRSLDMFWNNQGDGKRKGYQGDLPDKLWEHVGPEGCLGDAAMPDRIAYKQGDGDQDVHDWFYEATAAGVVMEAEFLLRRRDPLLMHHYLPKMEKACNFIEKARDNKNNLFLVGPASNLLAPSYAGILQEDGSFGKGYLAGLSVTYLAALDRMVELYKLTGDQEKLAEYSNRQKITRESLALLLTDEGYFIKSMEPDGTRHGVTGQEKFGYLEGVVNADAAGLRVADKETAEKIYKKIASFPEIRPFDYLLTNAPGLDDTYWNYGNATGKNMGGSHEFGSWVNGGAWGTVEGRAILMYSRLKKFPDIYRSGIRTMKWGKDFRFDDHFTQRGENTYNLWNDGPDFGGKEGVTINVDNFAIPAAIIRGLFDYEYLHDRLILRPSLPPSITRYRQKEPVFFGEKQIFIQCRNGGPNIKSVSINGKKIKDFHAGEISLQYDNLPMVATIVIVTTGGWNASDHGIIPPEYPVNPSVNEVVKETEQIPDSLARPYRILLEFRESLENEAVNYYDQAFITAAIETFRAYLERTGIDPGKGYFREIDANRKKAMEKAYATAALRMYEGVMNRMKIYRDGNENERKIADSFFRLL